MFGKKLFGSSHDETRDTTWTQPYALANGSYLHQARCSCGWFSDLYLEDAGFVAGLRETHDRTGQ